MQTFKVSYYGPGAVRSLGLRTGYTRVLAEKQLTQAIMKAHGHFLVIHGLRDRTATHVGHAVTDRELALVCHKVAPGARDVAEVLAPADPSEPSGVLATTTEEPVIEEQVIEEPVIEEPVIEEPVIEEIAPEEIAPEEPVIEEIAPEEPVIEEQVLEDNPFAEEPATETPATQYIPSDYDGRDRKTLIKLIPDGTKPKRSRADVVLQLIDLGIV